MPNPQPPTDFPQLFHTIAWTIARSLAGLTVGMLVAFVLVIAVEFFSAVVHPLPPDFKGTQEEICAHVARYPAWVLALVVPAWSLTAFAGTLTAGRIGARAAALFVGLLLILAVLFNVSMLPYPSWFRIFAVAGVIAGVLVAIRRTNCCPRPQSGSSGCLNRSAKHKRQRDRFLPAS